jgi:transcription elongation factor Elf1
VRKWRKIVKKKPPIWGCKRCEKTRAVKWFEVTKYKTIGFYICRDCQRYERTLSEIQERLDALCSLQVNKTVKRALDKIQAELSKLTG